MSLYADENIDFEEDGGQAEEGTAARRRKVTKPTKEEDENAGEDEDEEEDEEEEVEEEEDEEDEYDALEDEGGSSKKARSSRAKKGAAAKSKAKPKAAGKGRGAPAAATEIPPELMRRSSRQVTKPLRYAEQDKEDDKKKKEEKEKPPASGSAKASSAQRGTKRTRAAAASVADETVPDPPQRRAKNAKKPAPAVAKEEEEVEEEEDLNVTSSDQPPSIVSSPVPADAAMRPKANAEESEEPEPEPQPEPQPPPQPKKPVAIPASSPARSGTVRRGRANVNRKPNKRRRKLPMPPWEPAVNSKLAQTYPDKYHKDTGAIEFINKRHPIKLHTQLQHPGNIFDMVWSSDGLILATCSSLGSIRLWDTTTWKLIQELRDAEEEKIEEFYTIRFSPDNTKLFAAGKLKHRDRWSNEDDDNQVAPGPIKLFDVVSGKVLTKLEGHTEEILCIKAISFKEKNYLLSASQDGYIIKWHLDDTWTVLEGTTRIDEETTNMALGLSFLPNCGNKYFMSAADGGVKIYDFEKEVLLQQFEEIYTGYCDCIKFINAKEYHRGEFEHYLVTRGVEMLSNSDPNQLLRSNACHLWKLTVPDKPLKSAENAFRLERVRTFSNPGFFANSWPAHITSNGRYLAAPTSQGEVFIWNLRTGDLVSVLTDHEDRETRDILFHATRPIMLTCCDDSTIKVYMQDDSDERAIIETVDLDGEIDVEGELADGEGEPLLLVTGVPEDDMEVEDEAGDEVIEQRSNGRSNGTGQRRGGRGYKRGSPTIVKKRMRIEEELEAEFGDEAWPVGEEAEAEVEEADKEWLKIEKEWQKIEDHYQKIEREWSEIKKERKRMERDRTTLRKLKEEAGVPLTAADYPPPSASTTTTTTTTSATQPAAAEQAAADAAGSVAATAVASATVGTPSEGETTTTTETQADSAHANGATAAENAPQPMETETSDV